MANTRGANLIVVDTSAAFADATNIVGIKYVNAGGTAASASIKKASSSGVVLWEASGEDVEKFEQAAIRCPQGIYVTVTDTGTKVYVYLK